MATFNKYCHIVFGKEIIIQPLFQDEYENALGIELTDDTIEYLLRQRMPGVDLSQLSDQLLTGIATEEICMEIYNHDIVVPIYNNTKIVSVDRHLAIIFASCRSFSSTTVEGFLEMNYSESELNKMSNKELSDAMTKIIKQDISDMLNGKEILEKYHII